MIEEWRKIKDYEGLYEISSLGRVKSFRIDPAGAILNVYEHWKGYKFIYIYREGVRKKFFVHRLVACAFLPNPTELPIVNHKDLDKANNILSNLEWVNESENALHWLGLAKGEEMPDVEF